MNSPSPQSNEPQDPVVSSNPAFLDLALGAITGPVLLGILTLRAGRDWLRVLSIEEPMWWFDEQLPPLEPETLEAREQSRSS